MPLHPCHLMLYAGTQHSITTAPLHANNVSVVHNAALTYLHAPRMYKSCREYTHLPQRCCSNGSLRY